MCLIFLSLKVGCSGGGLDSRWYDVFSSTLEYVEFLRQVLELYLRKRRYSRAEEYHNESGMCFISTFESGMRNPRGGWTLVRYDVFFLLIVQVRWYNMVKCRYFT